eukprot:Em0002g585a
MLPEGVPAEKVVSVWICGDGGVGKSRFVNWFVKYCLDHRVYKLPYSAEYKWWDGYILEKVVHIEELDLRSRMVVSQVKALLDFDTIRVEKKGSVTQPVRPWVFFITSNFTPQGVFQDQWDDALQSRFSTERYLPGGKPKEKKWSQDLVWQINSQAGFAMLFDKLKTVFEEYPGMPAVMDPNFHYTALRDPVHWVDYDHSLNEGGYSLCLSKGVVQSAVSNPLPLIWIAKQPFQDNVFTWTEDYNFYASDTTVQSGATIEQTSFTTEGITLDVPYQFISGAFQIGGAVVPSTTAYTLENDSGEGVILGVTQSANVDGKTVSSPIFGQYVEEGLDVSYQPQEVVSVFLQRQATNGQMVANTGSQVTVVTLSPQERNVKPRFGHSAVEYTVPEFKTVLLDIPYKTYQGTTPDTTQVDMVGWTSTFTEAKENTWTTPRRVMFVINDLDTEGPILHEDEEIYIDWDRHDMTDLQYFGTVYSTSEYIIADNAVPSRDVDNYMCTHMQYVWTHGPDGSIISIMENDVIVFYEQEPVYLNVPYHIKMYETYLTFL